MLNGDAPQLCLSLEPIKKWDENVIFVKVLLGLWKPIGYIPANKLPKVMDAMRKIEITVVALDNVIYRYVSPITCHRYFAKVLQTKKTGGFPTVRHFFFISI